MGVIMSITNQWVGFLPNPGVSHAQGKNHRADDRGERANRRVRRGDDNIRSRGARRPHDAGGAPVIRVSPDIIQLPQAKTLSTPWTTALCESQLSIACYGPDQIRAAYNVAPLYAHGITGKGETIVIVDSFGSPTIQNDLSVFDKQFGYPDPPSLKIITPAGPVTTEDPGWAARPRLTSSTRTRSRREPTSSSSRRRMPRPRASPASRTSSSPSST